MAPEANSIVADYSSPTIDLTLEDDDVSLSNSPYSRIAHTQAAWHAPFKSHLSFKMNPHASPFEASSSTLPSAMSNGMANMMIQPPQIPQMNQPGPSQHQVLPLNSPPYPQSLSMAPAYRPVFASNNLRPIPFASPPQHFKQHVQYSPPPTPPPLSSPLTPKNNPSNSNLRNIIDLTTSPSPEPQKASTIPADLPPKTPICIGQLTVTALVLYPVPYLSPDNNQLGVDAEWACVRLQYEHSPNKPNSQDTIHIKTPTVRGPSGEPWGGETFGVVEQKIATTIGPMLGKGLIRLEAKVRKGSPNLPILPLMLLVYTPKGNITVVSQYLQQNGLFLDHPTLPSDQQRLQAYHYSNPHNPPPGGYRSNVLSGQRVTFPGSNNGSRWTQPAISGKSVEVQRSQMDDLFKSLRSGDELQETEPTPDVATSLYSHQKKALTFLLEREREIPAFCDKPSSLWQEKINPLTGQKSWLHLVTQREVYQQPTEAKGAILADDMGLGKTITCVSLIASTLKSARDFASTPVKKPPPPPPRLSDDPYLSASHFTGTVWGMPDTVVESSSAKGKAKAMKEQDKQGSEYARACRIKTKSRATLIICPLSTVSNWEDQFREHWKGEVSVVGGSSAASAKDVVSRQGQSTHSPLRVYVYHGNARKPDPHFLADYDAVITTYATLASEFSKQTRSAANPSGGPEAEEDEYEDSGEEFIETDERGNQVIKIKATKCGMKRKKESGARGASGEVTSPLQSVNWFRVVLDEAHSIKETNTVGSKACCDLTADRRLCLTGTPVQNKLDDVFALIKFLRVEPLDEKSTWMEFIGTPVKYGQPLGVVRLQTIMKCITLRRTKESRTQDGQKILALPPRRDELRYLKFDKSEQEIYDRYFNESKAEFNELSDKNEVMKNYVGILQKILRLRQICDHFELVQSKEPSGNGTSSSASYESVVAAIASEGFNACHASAIFCVLKEAGTTQCVECCAELCNGPDPTQNDVACSVGDSTCQPSAAKRGKKSKATASRGSTRQSSPSVPRPVLTRCLHLFCIECFRQCVCPGWPGVAADIFRSCSVCQTGLSISDAIEVSTECTAPESTRRRQTRKEKRAKGIAPESFHPSTKIKALLGDLVQLSKGNPYSANYDPTSIEVQCVDNEGNMLDDGVVKTVVFSQWTSMLDKIEDALEAANIRYDRLDGTMKRDDRIRAMDALKHDHECEVLLVSLKAGGVGLNLTAAQRVYLMDPYWNPAVENQAVDRIHRLGQTRPVTTIKLIIENSIEARLLEVQRKKTELANMTLGQQNFSKAELLQRRMEELSQLFGT